MNAVLTSKKLIFLCITLTYLLANNHEPIFLIHGFMGWGRDELQGHYYWGGSIDLEDELRKQGFNVHTLSVGPLSSNWDRAIEAYTQIKGGCVDYGSQHSQQYHIIQEPKEKCYVGLYPEWDSEHPIHIIGHSQGGLTARMIEYLLEIKIKEEQSELLSESYMNYIKSITTISTPHNGTSLSFIINNTFPSLKKLTTYAGLINILFKQYYNFDLEQWDLTKNEDESYYQFINRINNSNLYATQNSAAWDVSINGAKYFNNLSQSNNSTYYFSYTTSSTIKKNNSQYHKPSNTMSYYLQPSARIMGSDKTLTDSLWYENDGIVNTISMDGPHDEIIVEYSNEPIKGVWQHMGILNYDHHQILCRRMRHHSTNDIINFYSQHCKLLYSL